MIDMYILLNIYLSVISCEIMYFEIQGFEYHWGLSWTEVFKVELNFQNNSVNISGEKLNQVWIYVINYLRFLVLFSQWTKICEFCTKKERLGSVFRWGTHLYMSLFLSARPSDYLSIVDNILRTVHHVITIFGTHV